MAGETRIYLCGPLIVRFRGERIEGALPGRQGRLLFAYLMLNRGRPLQRDDLVGALWPGEVPEGALSALNPLLSKVRKVLGTEVLTGRSAVTLELPEGSWVDLEAAEEALHRAESFATRAMWADAWSPSRVVVHIAARKLLQGFEAPWIDRERERLTDLRIRALECFAKTCLGLGGTELPAAERSARTLVEIAPYRESGHRLLMQALASVGNPAEGLRVYEDLRALLREELGVSPGEATQALHGQLLEACR